VPANIPKRARNYPAADAAHHAKNYPEISGDQLSESGQSLNQENISI
jgi:hypothetical protein